MFYKRVSNLIWQDCRSSAPAFKHYTLKRISNYIAAFSILSFAIGFGLGIITLWLVLRYVVYSTALPEMLQLAIGG
jgi:hypothetical protein